MRPTQRVLAVLVAISPVLSGWPAHVQGADWRRAENPFQEEFPYRVNSELAPNVEVDGVRWSLLRVEPKDPANIPSGKEVAATVHLNFENTGADGATLTVILLFEDEVGNSLQRVECPAVKVGSGASKQFREKVKVQGDVLLATAKIYVFCEVSR